VFGEEFMAATRAAQRRSGALGQAVVTSGLFDRSAHLVFYHVVGRCLLDRLA